MDKIKKREFEISACKARIGVINAVHAAKSGHPGGSLSICDVLTYLYFNRMNVNPENPRDPCRDRFVLSKGHCAPALYSVLAQRGFIPEEELTTLRKPNSRLQGHPNMNDTPGVDMSTGSLGQGISAACGMALSAKLSGEKFKVYAILGDGEIEEGQVWEAAMFAAAKKLDNLTAIVDNNGLQIDGKISEVNSPEPIDEKFKAFGWNVIKMDAHDFDDIDRAFSEIPENSGKPTVIIQKSIKGKGVSFMENQVGWHGTAPNDEQRVQAIDELSTQLQALERGVRCPRQVKRLRARATARRLQSFQISTILW